MTESEFERAVETGERIAKLGLSPLAHDGMKCAPPEVYWLTVDEIAKALLHARDAALEEAAKAAFESVETCDECVVKIGHAIQALKSNQSKAPEGGGGR